MQLPGLEAVLTLTFIKNVGLKLVAGTRRPVPGHVSLPAAPAGGGRPDDDPLRPAPTRVSAASPPR